MAQFPSLVPRPTPFFSVLRFAFTIIHRPSASVYYCQRKPKTRKKWGRPGNEANSSHHSHTECNFLFQVYQFFIGPVLAEMAHQSPHRTGVPIHHTMCIHKNLPLIMSLCLYSSIYRLWLSVVLYYRYIMQSQY